MNHEELLSTLKNAITAIQSGLSDSAPAGLRIVDTTKKGAPSLQEETGISPSEINRLARDTVFSDHHAAPKFTSPQNKIGHVVVANTDGAQWLIARIS